VICVGKPLLEDKTCFDIYELIGSALCYDFLFIFNAFKYIKYKIKVFKMR